MKPEAIESYKKAGHIAGRAREYGASLLKPGVTLTEVATAVEKFIYDNGGSPAFPCCISIDADAAHDTAAAVDDRTFAAGQVVKLDCGVQVNGWIGDTAITVEIESEKYAPLREAAMAALDAAIATVRPNVEIRDVSEAIENAIRSRGFKPVANLTGHSVDQYHQHAGTSIPNVAATARGRLEPGMVVAIEPFATDGDGKVKDSSGGHIWHFNQPRPQRDPLARKALEHIAKNYNQLPFSERWVSEVIPAAKVPYAMKLLARSGATREYPVLRETGGGQVAQFEHTFVILEDEVIITTK